MHGVLFENAVDYEGIGCEAYGMENPGSLIISVYAGMLADVLY